MPTPGAKVHWQRLNQDSTDQLATLQEESQKLSLADKIYNGEAYSTIIGENSKEVETQLDQDIVPKMTEDKGV